MMINLIIYNKDYKMHNRHNLEARIKRLEKLVYEKSAIRSHAPSKSFLVWKFLSDHNGAIRDVIKATFPEEEQNSISSVLIDCLEEGIITLVGEKYFANKRYVWDDFGVFDSDDQKVAIDNVQYLMNRIK